MRICTHSLVERETAYADGFCPMCLAGRLYLADRVVGAAKRLLDRFDEVTKECHEKLVIGQTLGTASKNWETLDNEIDIAELRSSLSAIDCDGNDSR